MLKDNRLLIGLGIGLIIGAILLQLMNIAITGVSQDDLLKDNSVVLYTQSEMDEAVLKASQSVVQGPVVQQSVVEIPSEIPDKVNTTSYLIRIESGMVTGDVTKLLISVGLISDAHSFEEELSRRKLNKKIQVGTFEFLVKPSLTDLINKITSPL